VPAKCQLLRVMKVRELTHKGKTFYEVCWFKGKERKRKWYSTKANAKAKLTDLKKSEKKGQKDWESLKDDDREKLYAAWKRSQAGNYDLLTACLFFEKGGEPQEPIEFNQAADLFLKAKTSKGLRPESLKSYRSTFNQFGALNGSKKFDELTTEKVADWLDGQNYSIVRFNRALADLGTLRNWSEKNGYSVGRKSPFASIERKLSDQTDVAILTVDEAASYLAKAVTVPECAAIVVLVLCCGLRVSEALQTRRQDIDLDDGIVTVRGQAAKLRARRICTLQPMALKWLKKALKVATLPLSQSVYDKARRANLDAIPANSLRHSFCSYHLAQFKNIGETAEEAGNSAEMINKHYKELVRPKQAAKFWNI